MLLFVKKKIFLLAVLFTVIGLFNNSVFAKNKKIFLKNNKEKDNKTYFLTSNDEATFKTIKKYIVDKEWFQAYKLEKKIQNEGFRLAINMYISLHKFINMDLMTPQEVSGLIEFNTENYFLSHFNYFNNRIEFYYLNDLVKYEDVKTYFSKFKSKNLDINIKLLKDERESIISNNGKSSTDAELKKPLFEFDSKVRNIWINGDFSDEEQKNFLATFSHIIDEKDIIAKAEIFVFKRNFSGLKKIINLIQQKNYKILFEKIIEINNNPESVNNILKNIPRELVDNEALSFEKIISLRKNSKNDEVIDILLNLRGKYIFESYWWTYKNIYIRDLMREKNYKKAYSLASSYNGARNSDYAESRWLSGWLSFRYLNNKDKAIEHFSNLYKMASYPATLSKAGYWLGRVYESKNNQKEALNWYEKSSRYPLTFYGQLSHYAKYNILTKEGKEYNNFEFPAIPTITDEDRIEVDKNKIVKFAFLYYNYEGRREEANNIFKELVSKLLKKRGEVAELIEIVETLDDEKIIIPLSKLASYRSIVFIDNLFPILRMVKKTDENIALIHSIIKQESGFIIQSESNVGAIGFMQIMPATAKLLCQQLKITYNQYKLKHDAQYNIKLGSYYIDQLIKQFGGSKILAISSYNAGPGATNRWIRDFGDPRESDDMETVIDWMESITYKETRNYVQKILENLVVYESLLEIE